MLWSINIDEFSYAIKGNVTWYPFRKSTLCFLTIWVEYFNLIRYFFWFSTKCIFNFPKRWRDDVIRNGRLQVCVHFKQVETCFKNKEGRYEVGIISFLCISPLQMTSSRLLLIFICAGKKKITKFCWFFYLMIFVQRNQNSSNIIFILKISQFSITWCFPKTNKFLP